MSGSTRVHRVDSVEGVVSFVLGTKLVGLLEFDGEIGGEPGLIELIGMQVRL